MSRYLRRLPTRVLPSASWARTSLASRIASAEPNRLFARNISNQTRVAPIVTYEQLKPLTEQPSLNRFIIDVREVDEVQQGSIPSAVNVPLSVLSKALEQTPDSFRNTYGFEKPEKSQEVVFYCRSGVRSTTASELAMDKGWKNVKNYTGSWLDWCASDLQRHKYYF